MRESLEKEESELHWFVAVCEDQNELIDEAVEIFNAEERELWIEKEVIFQVCSLTAEKVTIILTCVQNFPRPFTDIELAQGHRQKPNNENVPAILVADRCSSFRSFLSC